MKIYSIVLVVCSLSVYASHQSFSIQQETLQEDTIGEFIAQCRGDIQEAQSELQKLLNLPLSKCVERKLCDFLKKQNQEIRIMLEQVATLEKEIDEVTASSALTDG